MVTNEKDLGENCRGGVKAEQKLAGCGMTVTVKKTPGHRDNEKRQRTCDGEKMVGGKKNRKREDCGKSLL